MWEVEGIVKHEQYIHFMAKNKRGLKLNTTFIYASTDYKKRDKLWEVDLIELSKMIIDPWIILRISTK